jgi:hypothetical protein
METRKILSLPGVEPWEWVVLLLSIREVPDPNLDPEVGYSD